jgi:acetyltransferase-like isoleucine patch superfamily enzyme
MKRLLKSLAAALAMALVMLPWLCYRLESLLLGTARVFPGWSQAMALLPGMPGVYLRRAFYRLTLAQCGEDAWIDFGSVFSRTSARVGDRVYVGPYCSLGDVTLEDDVLLAAFISVTSGARQHGIDRLDVPIREQPGVWAHVTIGRDSWIGERATVMADVGRQCVVGAGAVVVSPLPERAIAVGVPAKVVRVRGEG